MSEVRPVRLAQRRVEYPGVLGWAGTADQYSGVPQVSSERHRPVQPRTSTRCHRVNYYRTLLMTYSELSSCQSWRKNDGVQIPHLHAFNHGMITSRLS